MAAGAILATFLVIGLGAFPVSALRGIAERKLSKQLGAPVIIGALSRAELFSFTPEIIVSDVRIGQPEWAGAGDLLKIGRARSKLSILSLITGIPARVRKSDP